MSRTRRRNNQSDVSSEVKLSAPAAVRALAHPARLTIVDQLYQGLDRTASELAELTGLSPSAMSYHLRALQRSGIVVRGERRGDGRERPWRAAARSLTLSSDDPASTVAAADVITGGYLEHLRSEFRRWSLAEASESDSWRRVSGIRRSFLWLSEAEATAAAAEFAAIVDKYTAGRDAAQHPTGTRRLMCLLALVPEATEREPETPR
ncbi:MAG TPA: metalloregulator ArsR/SmtB family transcription factor [Gaiellaceae bacterium]|jgi:DNA-binding transcriptional ArsR family regulator|nr:metalloregulator ArsR/SmtB family transcription factor [Gaiellaceae bacterium]